MASQGNYKPTTGKATGNGRRSSIAVEWLQLGFFWFILLVKTCTHGPELRSKYAYKKQDLERMGRDKTEKKLPGMCLEELGSTPERRKSLLHAKSLAIIFKSMKPAGTVLVHPDGQSFPQHKCQPQFLQTKPWRERRWMRG